MAWHKGESMKNVSQTSAPRLVSRRQLVEYFGIDMSNAHMLRLELVGDFPRRIHFTPGKASWLASEIEAWIDYRVKNRDSLPKKGRPRGLVGAV